MELIYVLAFTATWDVSTNYPVIYALYVTIFVIWLGYRMATILVSLCLGRDELQ